MVEKSQSAMRVIALVCFTAIFAGAWANDRPSEMMAQKQMPKSTTILTQEQKALETQALPEANDLDHEVQNVVAQSPQRPVLGQLKPVAHGMLMTISVETEGLTINDKLVGDHLQRLPLGIANGDYLMVDADGGVGWLRIRGQAQLDNGEMQLTTSVNDATVRYIRVTPVDAALPVEKVVPSPVQYAGEESKTIR